MQFYRIEGTCADSKQVEDFLDRKSARNRAQFIQSRNRIINRASKGKGFISFCDVDEDRAVICAIVNSDTYDLNKRLAFYQNATKIDLKDVVIEEVVYNSFEGLLRNAMRGEFIEDDDEVKADFDLDSLNRRWCNWDENLIDDIDSKEAVKLARTYLGGEEFTTEINRIFMGSSKAGVKGHPVHYVVQTDDRDNRREMYRLLLGCLHSSGRLNNLRYAFSDVEGDDDWDRIDLEPLYKMSGGGCIVIRYKPLDADEDYLANAERNIVEHLCELIKTYRNKVLTILCFPRECTKIKSMFYGQLANMSFVEIKEDFAYGELAKDYLKMLAKKNNVRADKKLLAMVEENKGYLSADLVDMFGDWYDLKLRTSIYPQYKDTMKIKKQVQEEKPKGTAYDRLQEMIGLDSAKDVILQAIDYFKAQKLFKEKGMRTDRPAMHMIFTGNPGTAKTTVARLFAEIMKDNGLLSKGHMVECGRSDLVGKYVGWTAPTVQKKFKQAMGGVLFIDEAYSLVDDREGLFGDEAINTIVQEMENHRDDLVVIFAGYPDKMEGFLQKNPGLRSRIAFHVSFDDYSAEELCGISKLLAKDKNLIFEDAALEKLQNIYEVARIDKDFGNGRYARNILEKARMKQAGRLVRMNMEDVTDEDVRTITAEDIEIPRTKGCVSEPHRVIGFCA